MGIQIKFNPDLALRSFGTKGRLETGCLPKELEVGKIHAFLKKRSKELLVRRRNSIIRNKRKSRSVKTFSKYYNY